MKTSKEKAVELIQKFGNEIYNNIKGNNIEGNSIDYLAKSCASIAVDEILDAKPIKPLGVTNTSGYWQQVKIEITR